MARPQPDSLAIWARMMEMELRWARRWRNNVALFPDDANWRAVCRKNMRTSALHWRVSRAERRSVLGLPDIPTVRPAILSAA